MNEETTWAITTDVTAARDGDAFAAFNSQIGELARGARHRADQRGEHGRRWALVYTKLEEAQMHANRGYIESAE